MAIYLPTPESSTTPVAASGSGGVLPVSVGESYLENVRASAYNWQAGRTVNLLFLDEIGDIRRRETVLWPLLTKKPANSPIVKQARRDSFPAAGAINGHDLSTVSTSAPTNTALNLSDPGQEIKALGGQVRSSHLQESLARQQGYPFGDQFAQDTVDVVTNTYRVLEKLLISGNATANPLEFNGLLAQMPSGNTLPAVTVTTLGSGTPISNALNRAVLQIQDANENIRIKPTHILTSATGAYLLQTEWQNQIIFQNVSSVVPGVSIPAIMNGSVPIVQSPYIRDVGGGSGTDTVRYYIVDMNLIEWYGVMPMGGSEDPAIGLEVQLFDTTVNQGDRILIESRMALIYGTLFAKHGGAGIYRLNVTVPSGTSFSAL
jgi:hypothetical protein